MGHHFNCLYDEYEQPQIGLLTECGHSIMASHYFTNNNYCYCNNQPAGQNKCAQTYGDHGWDPTPPNTGALQTGTAWINLAPTSPYPISSTPDNYDFHDFNFATNGVTVYAPLVRH